MSIINRIILTTDTNGVKTSGLSNVDGPTAFRRVENLLGRAAQGGCAANMKIAYAPIAAQAKLTVTGTGSNGDTITIAGIEIAMVTSGADASLNQVNIGGSASALADRVVGLVNGTTASSPNSWNGICSAVNANGVITLTASVPGTIGNGLALAENGSSVTLTNAFGSLTAGTEGTAATFSLGL